MGLRHGDTKEPIAAQVCICPMDAGNGGKADQEQIQYLIESSLCGTTFGATWDHPSEAAASCVGTRRGDSVPAFMGNSRFARHGVGAHRVVNPFQLLAD